MSRQGGGVTKTKLNLHEVLREFNKLPYEIMAGAKARAPVRTGYLRDSITVRKQSGGYEVHVGAKYGLYVEYGTRNAPAQPYLTPAAQEAIRRFIRKLRS